MPIPVLLPRLSQDMTEGTIERWLVQEGAVVQAGEPLLELQTDKALTEVVAPAGGILAGIRYPDGALVAVGTVVAHVLARGELASDLPGSGPAPEAAPPAQPAAAAAAAPDPAPPRRVIASPHARRLARRSGVDLARIQGRGPGGRIIAADVEAAAQASAVAAPAAAAPAAPTSDGRSYQALPLSRIRQVTAERLARAWSDVPTFTLDVEVDMTEAARWRERAAARVSYTALLARAVAAALRRHPQLNSSFHGNHLRVYREVNLGVAVAGPDGLTVPVIRGADGRSVAELGGELARLAGAAQSGRLAPADLDGGTFTLSNLGMYGVDSFTAVVNPPQAAILAAGRIRPVPVAAGESVEVRPVLSLRLSADHRAVDGADAARFLADVKSLLENPYLML